MSDQIKTQKKLWLSKVRGKKGICFFWAEEVNGSKVHLIYKLLLSFFQVTLLWQMKHVVTAEISVKNKRCYHKVHISMVSKLPIRFFSCLHCYSPGRSVVCAVFIVMAVVHVRWCWCTRADTRAQWQELSCRQKVTAFRLDLKLWSLLLLLLLG